MKIEICSQCGNTIPSYSQGICYVCIRNERDKKKYPSGRLGIQRGNKKYIEPFRNETTEKSIGKKKGSYDDVKNESSKKALNILTSLFYGVDPFKKTDFESESPFQNMDVIRALFCAIECIKKREDSSKREKNKNKSFQAKQYSDKVFDQLKKWRLEQAKKEEVPPFVIAHDQTLKNLANKQPRDKFELMEIKGLGEKKVEKYGDIICDIIRKVEEES